MSSLFKPVIVSYRMPDGRKVPKGTPGAHKHSCKARNWYGQYRDADGRLKRVPLCPSKAAARDLLAVKVTDAAKGKAGLTDPFEEHHRRQLSEHVADFEAYLKAKGTTAKHASMTAMHTRTIIEGCKFKYIADISAARVMELLADKRKDRAVEEETDNGTETQAVPGMSAQTSNHYLRAAKGFSRWLVRDRRTAADALQHLSRLNVQTDRRHERRAMDAEEFNRLVAAARGTAEKPAEQFRELDGPARAMLYTAAACTGFRASELASLTPSSFDLKSTPATATVEAGYSKRRRHDVQPLPPALVPILGAFLADKPADARVWPGTWPEKAARMLRLDLSAAREAWIAAARTPNEATERRESDFLLYEDDNGRVFDFHALRGQYITSLGRAGVPLVTAQKLARHSDPKLTANVYTHLAIIDLGAAVQSLPVPVCTGLALTQAVA